MSMRAALGIAAGATVPRHNVAAKPLSLVLQGSGTHGAFSWGLLDKLLEDGRIEIDAISASGGAAFNAALCASGIALGGKKLARERLEGFWRALSRLCVSFNPVRRMPHDAFLGFAGLSTPLSHRWFESLTQFFGPRELNPLNINPFRLALGEIDDVEAACRIHAPRIALVATNVQTGERRLFRNRDVRLDTILAASCIPTLFHPVKIGREYFWEGRYSSGVAADIAASLGSASGDILVSQVQPVRLRELPRSAVAIRERMLALSERASMARELQLLARTSSVRVHAICSGDVMSDLSVASAFETDWASLTRMRDLGRHAAELWVSANFEHIGVRSTVGSEAQPEDHVPHLCIA